MKIFLLMEQGFLHCYREQKAPHQTLLWEDFYKPSLERTFFASLPSKGPIQAFLQKDLYKPSFERTFTSLPSKGTLQAFLRKDFYKSPIETER